MGRSSTWDSKTLDAYAAIREYRKAASLFLRGHPSPESSRERFDTAKDELVRALLTPGVADRISSVIAAGSTLGEPSACLQINEIAIRLEFSLASEYGLRESSVALAVDTNLILEDGVEVIESPNNMISQLTELHNKAIIEVTEQRQNPDRIEKKKRKRNIGQAVTSALFGTGCFIGNSYALPGYPHAAISYAVGAAALHQSARDVIGEAPKE